MRQEKLAALLINLTIREVNELAVILKEEYGIEPPSAPTFPLKVKEHNPKPPETVILLPDEKKKAKPFVPKKIGKTNNRPKGRRR